MIRSPALVASTSARLVFVPPLSHARITIAAPRTCELRSRREPVAGGARGREAPTRLVDSREPAPLRRHSGERCAPRGSAETIDAHAGARATATAPTPFTAAR